MNALEGELRVAFKAYRCCKIWFEDEGSQAGGKRLSTCLPATKHSEQFTHPMELCPATGSQRRLSGPPRTISPDQRRGAGLCFLLGVFCYITSLCQSPRARVWQMAGVGVMADSDKKSLASAGRAPFISGGTTYHEILSFAGGAETSLRAQHLLHIRLEVAHERTVSTFMAFVNEPRVKPVSIMDHTPGQRQYVDVSAYRKFYANRFRWTEEHIDEAVRRRLELQEVFGERNRRRLIELLRSTGIPVASHDDTTVEHVDEARADGMSISEFPTTLEAAERAHQLGMKVVVGAPNLVQGGSHSGNVSAETLGQRGILDALSSDYVPISLLQGVFVLHERLQEALPEAVAKASSVPAQILKLDDRGVLTAGYLADLVRVRYLRDTPCVVAVWRSGRRVA